MGYGDLKNRALDGPLFFRSPKPKVQCPKLEHGPAKAGLVLFSTQEPGASSQEPGARKPSDTVTRRHGDAGKSGGSEEEKRDFRKGGKGSISQGRRERRENL